MQQIQHPWGSDCLGLRIKECKGLHSHSWFWRSFSSNRQLMATGAILIQVILLPEGFWGFQLPLVPPPLLCNPLSVTRSPGIRENKSQENERQEALWKEPWAWGCTFIGFLHSSLHTIPHPFLLPSSDVISSHSSSHHLLSGDCDLEFPCARHVTSPAQTFPICEISSGHSCTFNSKGLL